jgi:plasmid stabilization system protein ParE
VSGTYEKSVDGLPYVVAYALRQTGEGTEDVVILRVIHTSRNWPVGGWPRP